MNYAQKSLDLATADLQTARTTADALKALLEGPLMPQQLTLTTAAGSVTVPVPAFEGEDARAANDFYAELLNGAELRVRHLEEQQLYWCEEVLLLAKQQQQADKDREARRQAEPSE